MWAIESGLVWLFWSCIVWHFDLCYNWLLVMIERKMPSVWLLSWLAWQNGCSELPMFSSMITAGMDGDLPLSHQSKFRNRGPFHQMQNDMEVQIHSMELEAYSSVLRAFKAQSDAITWVITFHLIFLLTTCTTEWCLRPLYCILYRRKRVW